MSHRVMIIENDRHIASLVARLLGDEGYSVEVLGNGSDGLAATLKKRPELLIMELVLPGMDGLSICRRLRNEEYYIPILFLTEKASELDRILGLEMGADDYMTKPFSTRELVARVKALLRRTEALGNNPCDPPTATIDCGNLHIDLERRSVTAMGKAVSLTAREFDLLHFFARHPGRVYSRMQLLESIWGYGYKGYEHTVNSHINRLRAKIEEDTTQPMYILTVRGVGYKFTESP